MPPDYITGGSQFGVSGMLVWLFDGTQEDTKGLSWPLNGPCCVQDAL
jgi:hypothetical protein